LNSLKNEVIRVSSVCECPDERIHASTAPPNGQYPLTALEKTTKADGIVSVCLVGSLLRFAHLVRSKVKSAEVPRRNAISIVLLMVLLTGITPTEVCALMCERHARAESQRHCGEPSDTMPGMAHDHSTMNRPGVRAMTAVLMSHSCETNCVTAERLNVWREVVPQVTVVRSSTVALGPTTKSLAPDFTVAWGLDSGPPARTPARAASFSILRI
jgi:hypothetical protein